MSSRSPAGRPDFRPDVTRLIDAVRQIAADRRPDEAPAPGPPEVPMPPGHRGGWAPIPWMPEPPDRTDPATGRRPRVLVDQPGPTVATLAFSPAGQLLATCGGARHGLSRSEVFLWDLGGPS